MSLVARVTAFLFVAGALLALPSGQAGAQQQVAVSLNDVPYEVTANPSSVAAGAVDFQVSNDGLGLPHNLLVIRTDLAPDALPMSGGQVDESQVNVVAATSQNLVQGATETVSANLAGGNYVLICNVSNHYGQGMYTAFTVIGAPTATPTDTATPTPTDTATPTPTEGGATGATATPTAGGTQLPQTGSGAETGSSEGWLVLAMLAGAGIALVGLGVAYRRRWRGG